MDLTRWLEYWPAVASGIAGLVLGCGATLALARRHHRQHLQHLGRECIRLQRSEHALLTTMEAAGGGHWEWDLLNKTVVFHGHFYAPFDLPQDTWMPVRTAWRRVRHPHQKLVHTRVECHPAGATPVFEAEFMLRSRQGRRHWIQSRGRAVVTDASGQPVRMVGMHYDVTAKHDAEEARRISQEKFESIFQTLPDAAGISRISDGLFLEINPAYTETVGYTRAEALGRTSAELQVWANAQERRAMVEHYQRHGHVAGLPMTARHRDGHLIKGIMSARKITIGLDDCFVFLLRDTTENEHINAQLHSANALLQAAGRIARVGGWQLSFDLSPHVWSEVCRNIHGLGPDDPIPHHYVDVFVAPPFRQALRSCLRDCRDHGTGWDLSLQIIRTDGRWLWVRFMGEAVYEGGRVARIRGIAQDIDAERRQLEQLRQSEERFSRIFHLMPDAMGITRQSDGHYLDVNSAWENLLGHTRDQALGRSSVDLGVLTARDREAMIAQTRQSGHSVAYEVTLYSRQGRAITGLHSMRPIDIDGQACWLFGFKDITERKRDEALLQEREALLSLAMEAGALGLWDWNLQTQTVTGNRRWIALNGLPAHQEAFHLDQWKTTIHPEDRPRVFDLIKLHMAEPSIPYDVIRRTQADDARVRWIRDVGQVVLRDDAGQPQRMVGVDIDVTDQQEHEQQLQRIAHTDPLTGLPNRFTLADRLQQGMRQVDRLGGLLGVAYLDLDGFKPVNDRLGHGTGDQLLVELAQRLQSQMRNSDTVARLGGDEFVLLLTSLDTLHAAEQALMRIMTAASEPYLLQGEWINVTASIGATLYPQDLSDTDTLLRHADQAMYVAKQAGRNRYQFFDTAQDQASRERSQQRARLRQAMEQGELVLHYQPKADMHGQRIIGAEALVRWQHPELGLLAPGSFLPALEDSDLEIPFGEWVLATALVQLSAWQTQGQSLPVSINITARHLQTPAFAPRMLALLGQHPHLREGLLEIEITESAALHDLDTVLQVLEQLHQRGVRVALDDFGTGYSSLTYLRRLPIDTIKIDRGFVRDMLVDPEDLAIVVAVIGLATSFGLEVIAEGVESPQHGQRLLQLGCALAQGYGIARPMPAERLSHWMSTRPASLWAEAG